MIFEDPCLRIEYRQYHRMDIIQRYRLCLYCTKICRSCEIDQADPFRTREYEDHRLFEIAPKIASAYSSRHIRIRQYDRCPHDGRYPRGAGMRYS